MTSITSLAASLVGISVLTFSFTPLVSAQDQGQSQNENSRCATRITGYRAAHTTTG
jgi:hypothetical protein